MSGRESPVKKRKPLLAALLSLVWPGLGQIYNGELVRGLLVNAALVLAALVYALRIYTDGSRDRQFFLALIAIFAIVGIYATIQAFLKSRRLGPSFALKNCNRFWVYLAFPVLSLALLVLPGRALERHALADLSAWHPFRTEEAKTKYLELYELQAKVWPVASETRLVETSFGRTFVRISGPEDGPPLVLLHGASATSLMWAANIEALSAEYRTYAPDNIYDLGRSVFTRRVKTPRDFVKWLNELFNALELGDHVSLIGQSYGGWIAGQYLLRYPGRLDKAVLLAPAMTVLPFRSEFLKRGLLGSLPFRRFTRSMMFWLLEDLARKGEAGRRLVEDYIDHIYRGQAFFKPKALVKPTLLSDEDWAGIKVPTLVLVGENEKIYSARKAIERLNKVAPVIRTGLVPGAGHDLTLAQAEMVNAMILEFLGGVKSP